MDLNLLIIHITTYYGNYETTYYKHKILSSWGMPSVPRNMYQGVPLFRSLRLLPCTRIVYGGVGWLGGG